MASTSEPVGENRTATPVESTILSGEESKSDIKSSPEAVKGSGKENSSPARKIASATTVKKPALTTAAAARRTSTTSSSATKPATTTSRTSTSGSTLNKPPTRPSTTTTSTTRRPGTTTTTATHRSRPSISSSADEKGKLIAGSGDEKKDISSAVKRASLASTQSTRAPTKTASSVDRRASTLGATSTADRKPTTSVRSSAAPTSRASVKPTVNTAGRTATSTTSARTSAHATAADTAKSATSTKNAEEKVALQQQLAESETTITSLREELTALKRTTAALTQSAEDQAAKASAATEAIRMEHATRIEGLNAGHAKELQILQQQLEDAVSKHKDLEEKSVLEIKAAKEVAQGQNDNKTAQLLNELESAHQAELEKVQKELADEKAAAAATYEKEAMTISQLERELKGRDSVNDNLKTELQKLAEAKDRAAADAQEKAAAAYSSFEVQLAEFESKERVASEALERARADKSSLEAKAADLESRLAQAETAAQQSSDKSAQQLVEKDKDITEMNQIIEAMKSEIRALQTSSTDANTMAKELRSEHDQSLKRVKAQHDAETADLKTTHQTELEKALTAADAAQAQLEQLRESTEDSSAASKQEMDELKAAHVAELAALQKKLQASQEALAAAHKFHEETVSAVQGAASQEIASLKEKIDNLETQHSTEITKFKSLEDELGAKGEQVNLLQESLAALQSSSKAQTDKYELTLTKLRDEAAISAKLLEERSQEAGAIADRHASGLEQLKAEHSSELTKLRNELVASHEAAVQAHQAKYDELALSTNDRETLHVKDIEALQAQLKAAQDESREKVDSLTQSHKKTIDILNGQFEEAHANLRAEIEGSQVSKSAKLEAEHSRAIEELLIAHDAKLSDIRSELEASHQKTLDTWKQSHETALVDLQGQLDAAKLAAADTSAVDQLQAKLSEVESKLLAAEKAAAVFEERVNSTATELTAQHQSELATAQKEKLELLEKQQSALAQLEAATQSAAGQESLQLQIQTSNKQLAAAEEEVTLLKSSHEKVVKELELTKSHNQAMEAKLEQMKSDQNEQAQKNMSLIDQLTSVEASISTGRKRVRELEAELAALKENSNQNTKDTVGLGQSKWADSDDENGTGPNPEEGEDLGSSIEGTVG